MVITNNTLTAHKILVNSLLLYSEAKHKLTQYICNFHIGFMYIKSGGLIIHHLLCLIPERIIFCICCMICDWVLPRHTIGTGMQARRWNMYFLPFSWFNQSHWVHLNGSGYTFHLKISEGCLLPSIFTSWYCSLSFSVPLALPRQEITRLLPSYLRLYPVFPNNRISKFQNQGQKKLNQKDTKK